MKIKKDKKNSQKCRRVIRSLDGALLKEMVIGGAAELESNISEVNRLNVFPVPDGDTGDNMFSTVSSGVKAIEKLNTDNLAEVMRVLSHGMLLGARGNSGVILSQFFKGVADGFENSSSADPKELGAALELGVREAYGTVITPTEGTILTVAREAVEAAVSKINPKTTIKSFFGDFVKELHASVERTPESLPALKEAGVVDSGGAGLFYLMDGFNRVLKGERFDSKKTNQAQKQDTGILQSHNNEIQKDIENGSRQIDAQPFDENSTMEFSYCTELLVQLTRAKCDTDSFDMEALKEFLASIGDSCVSVKSGSVVKIHVHTLRPDKIIAFMLEFGEFINVKVENMSLQHSELDKKTSDNSEKGKETFTKSSITSESSESKSKLSKKKKYGVVAVSNGDGIEEIFKKLGADETIDARGAHNPSAYDFLQSARRTEAEQVFIFPNNSNFILSAEQAAKMAEGFIIHVIPSKSIAVGYAALSVMNFECESTQELTRIATKAMNNAISGSVFIAARDAGCSGIKIKKGDFVGSIGKDICVKAKNSVDCSIKLCKRLLENRYVLTVFKGESAKDEESAAIEKRIKKIRPEAEIYTIDSGQDVFEYIFAAE